MSVTTATQLHAPGFSKWRTKVTHSPFIFICCLCTPGDKKKYLLEVRRLRTTAQKNWRRQRKRQHSVRWQFAKRKDRSEEWIKNLELTVPCWGDPGGVYRFYLSTSVLRNLILRLPSTPFLPLRGSIVFSAFHHFSSSWLYLIKQPEDGVKNMYIDALPAF